jgi:glucose-6-phosphate 1-epimerase
MQIAHESLGGQIISVDDFFYVSPLLPNESTSRRAGIPVLFPQFGEWGPLRKHGIVRNKKWQLNREEFRNFKKEIQYSLAIHSGEDPSWPYDAILDLRFSISSNDIHVSINIQNTGEKSFIWSGGLHPYFSVANLLEVRVRGFQNCPVRNKFDPTQSRFEEEFLGFSEKPCESLFDSIGSVELLMTSGSLILSATGFNQWMVWNPGKDGAREIHDLPDEDWNKFLCIEPAIVDPAMQLNPGQTFSGTLRIERKLEA